jgi:hypothetical protein
VRLSRKRSPKLTRTASSTLTAKDNQRAGDVGESEGQPADHHRHGEPGQHRETGASDILGEQRRLQVDGAQKIGADLTGADPAGQLTFPEDHHNGQ